MKKKVLLPVFALLAGLLVSCGGGETPTESESGKAPTSSKTADKSSTPAHTHTFDETKWEHNETNHWHPATCEHTTQKGASAAHTLVEDAAAGQKPTCSTPGKKVEKCSVCGYTKETALTAAHTYGTPTTEGNVTKEVCTVCGETVLSQNWNKFDGSTKADTDQYKWDKGFEYKWTFNSPKACTEAVLNIGAALSSSSHTDRAFVGNPDGASSSDSWECSEDNRGKYRITLKVNDTDVTSSVTTKTYGELGMSEANTVVQFDFATISIPAGNVVISFTTNPAAGYRLMLGGGALVKLTIK